MPSFFFEKHLRVNDDAYIYVMGTAVKPWMEAIAGNRHYIFQLHGSPAHNVNKQQTGLEENLKEFLSKEI